MKICSLHRGHLPLLVSLPHDGSFIPEELSARMTERARTAPDTDWFVSRLYGFAMAMGASVLVPSHSRYVVDLNRPPDDVSLYPGQNTTGLCPIVQFSGEPVYLEGHELTPVEIGARVESYWRPYHDSLKTELARLHAEHGRMLLWEGHSIRSRVPFLFEGQLPDFNFGTASGASCRPDTQARIEAILAAQSDFSWVVNGRFKGGHITRHYGRPADGIEAVQLELAQDIYMDEDAVEYLPDRAARVAALIERFFEAWLGA
jgi:N-formylglutamate deformylase